MSAVGGLVGLGLAAFVAGAAAGPLLARRPAAARWAAHLLAAAGGAAVAAAGAAALAGVRWTARVAWLLPPPGVELALDGLGGLFLVLIGGVAVPASLYAVGYLDRPAAAHGPVPARLTVAYNAFLGTMALVPLAANLLTFVVAWELMALASYLLVVAEPDERGVPQAGWVYALVTHAGLACLLAGMLLLAQAAGSDRLADWGAGAAALGPGGRSLVFVLLLLGFGSKAGLVPLHVWLPMAHPAAPSHVSALMSGVMIKLGVYGLLRAGFEWLPGGPPWWGVLLLLLGAGSALLGVLYALVEADLKRVLAHSSVEHVGIVLLGVGAGMVFRAAGFETLAGLGVVAALAHAVNHAAFKSLLFLGAGAVLHATGTRSLEALGGLVRRMPWTSTTFLVGALALAALPPLNGFVSEWLTFQALLQSFRVPRPDLDLAFLLALGALALTGGLAVACSVRAFGVGFLALPRTRAAEEAREVPGTMRAAMAALAAACAGLTLAAPAVLRVLQGVAPGGGAPPALQTGLLTLRVGGDFGRLSPLAVAALLGLALALVVAGLPLLGARADRRRAGTWGCGRLLQTARMEYTAAAFAQPFKRVFAVLYRPLPQLDIEFHPQSRFFVRTIRYENPARPLVEEWLYRPALAGARRLARQARRIQSGSASLYLAYIFAVLLGLLLLAAR